MDIIKFLCDVDLIHFETKTVVRFPAEVEFSVVENYSSTMILQSSSESKYILYKDTATYKILEKNTRKLKYVLYVDNKRTEYSYEHVIDIPHTLEILKNSDKLPYYEYKLEWVDE